MEGGFKDSSRTTEGGVDGGSQIKMRNEHQLRGNNGEKREMETERCSQKEGERGRRERSDVVQCRLYSSFLNGTILCFLAFVMNMLIYFGIATLVGHAGFDITMTFMMIPHLNLLKKSTYRFINIEDIC